MHIALSRACRSLMQQIGPALGQGLAQGPGPRLAQGQELGIMQGQGQGQGQGPATSRTTTTAAAAMTSRIGSALNPTTTSSPPYPLFTHNGTMASHIYPPYPGGLPRGLSGGMVNGSGSGDGYSYGTATAGPGLGLASGPGLTPSRQGTSSSHGQGLGQRAESRSGLGSEGRQFSTPPFSPPSLHIHKTLIDVSINHHHHHHTALPSQPPRQPQYLPSQPSSQSESITRKSESLSGTNQPLTLGRRY